MSSRPLETTSLLGGIPSGEKPEPKKVGSNLCIQCGDGVIAHSEAGEPLPCPKCGWEFG